MKGLNCFLELVDNGRAMTTVHQRHALHEPMVHLMAYAHERGELPAECAWQLDSSVSRYLERRHAMSPSGGWARLAGLACGGGMLRPGREAFEPAMGLAEVVALDEAEIRRRLCEAFTRRLIPPACAAGIFIMLGIHPAWGLWVAQAVHSRFGEQSDVDGMAKRSGAARPGWRDRSLFDPRCGGVLEDAIYGSIAGIIATLRKLDPARRYPFDAFAPLARAACHFARTSAKGRLKKQQTPGLDPFLPEFAEDPDPRNMDFAVVEFFDSTLIPAGVVRRFDDGTFCVFEGALDRVRVGDMDTAAQDQRLTWLLAGQANCMVA